MAKNDKKEDILDIDARLLEKKIHYLSGPIENDNIKDAIKWLLYWDTYPKTELTMYINSEGGEVYEAFALIELMKKSKHTIKMIGIGNIMSAGFLIFISGTKGHRYIGKNTGIMYHQHTDAYENKYHDLKAAMVENDNILARFQNCVKEASNYSIQEVKKLFPGSTDQYFTARELVKAGLADRIL